MALDLDVAARRAIDGHVRLLLGWNEAINLTAIREPDAIARLHVTDSLSAVALLRRREVDSFVDIGSGAGYPGVPLAAALPASRALLVDSVAKKAAFLETAVRATGLAPRVAVATSRAESLATHAANRERWPAVTSRAVGSVAETVELGFPLLHVGGVVVAWKRHLSAHELNAGRRAAVELGNGSVEIVPVNLRWLGDHVLVIATKRAATPRQYPRDPAQRRRRPW